jgi:hypothetical protein
MFGGKTSAMWLKGRAMTDLPQAPNPAYYHLQRSRNTQPFCIGPRRLFKQTAPVIKLPGEATEDAHLALPAKFSSACFWMKQCGHNKGDSTDDKEREQQATWFQYLRF